MMAWLIPSAFLLDLFFGDPRSLPHPVVLIGRFIRRLELLLAGLLDHRRLAGVLLVLITLTVVGGAAWGTLWICAAIHPWLGWLTALWLAWTTLSLRSLHQESREVVQFVARRDLGEARRSLSLIVGRQTAHLNEEEILRACIETVAENTSDGVVAPLFYLFLGGPVLALLYKAVSTLDSMIGYLDERYRELGWAAARLDDLLNLIPARLTALLMILAAFPLGLNGFAALKTVLRDARKHSSPNAGYPEAAAAGALGVQLGGPAVYFGRLLEKATLGDPDWPVTVKSYRRMVRLMYLTSFFALGLGMVMTWQLY